MPRVITLAEGQQIALENIDINFPESAVDFFGRLRVSDISTQLQIKHTSPSLIRMADVALISGTGGTTDFPNYSAASTQLNVGTTTCLMRMKSRVVGLYQNGKSILVFLTGSFNGPGQANVQKRIGYMDANEGIFLQQENGVISLNTRSSTIDNRSITQNNWTNQEFFDTNSPNYIDFNGGKTFIYWIGFEYLGVGDIFTGFVVNQNILLAHTISNRNLLTTKPYMRTPNLYLNWEIERTVDGGTADSMSAICGTVNIEGGQDNTAYTIGLRRVTNYATPTGSAGTTRVVFMVRLNPNYLNSRINIRDIQVYISSTATFYVEVIKDPTLSGTITPTWVDHPNSPIQYYEVPTATNTVTVTDPITQVGYESVFAGNSTTSTGISSSDGLTDFSFLGTKADYTPEVWAVCLTCATASETMNAFTMTLLEEV